MTDFSQCQITRVLPRVADLSQCQITGVLHRDKEWRPGHISRFNERQNRRPPSTKSESKVMEKAQIQSVSRPDGSGGSSTPAFARPETGPSELGRKDGMHLSISVATA